MKIKNLLLVMVFLAVSSTTYAKNFSYLDLEKSILNYQQKVLSLQSNIDKTIFNDEEILLSLDFDAKKIISFIQQKFVYQHYQGILRGVQGTLNSRSGNALDQSVLLAKLLNDAGYETRIANGKLNEKEASLLVSSIANASLPSNIGNGVAFEKSLAKFGIKRKRDINWQKTETYKRYKQSKSNLEKLFAKNDIQLNEVDITEQFIAQAQDYFWVEYHMGQSDKWVSAHPAFTKGDEPKVKAVSYFKDKVPIKYLHKLKIEAFIQQRVGDKLTTHKLMKAWERPTANLNNILISYSNTPSSINNESTETEVIENSNFFTPTFNGKPIGSKVFDMKGRLIDSSAMNTSAAVLFQTLGNKVEGALGKLNNKDPDNSLMQLTAQWLKFTFTQPDGTEFIQKRYLYETDNYKPIKKEIIKAKYSLTNEYRFLASSGEQSIAYIANSYLNLINDSIPLLQASANKVYFPNKKVSIKKEMINVTSPFELLVQNDLMQTNVDNMKVIKYKGSANLTGIKRGYADAENVKLTVDIVSNRSNYLIKKDNRIFLSPKAAFASGVWQTASEWLPSRFLGLTQSEINTLKVQSASSKQNIPMKIIKLDDLGTLEIKDKNIISRISQELNQGYTIVIPNKKPDTLSMSGWWRINLSTGETLGMTADGAGGDATEYMIKQVLIALRLVRAVGKLKKCQNINNDLKKLCCLTEAHFNNVGGLAFGGMLGAKLGTAGSAVFSIADFSTELATGSGLAPSTNGALCKGFNPPPNF